MPQSLWNVCLVPTSPLLNETGYVLNLLVVAPSVSFAVALGMVAEHISTSIRFQRRVVGVIANIQFKVLIHSEVVYVCVIMFDLRVSVSYTMTSKT